MVTRAQPNWLISLIQFYLTLGYLPLNESQRLTDFSHSVFIHQFLLLKLSPAKTVSHHDVQLRPYFGVCFSCLQTFKLLSKEHQKLSWIRSVLLTSLENRQDNYMKFKSFNQSGKSCSNTFLPIPVSFCEQLPFPSLVLSALTQLQSVNGNLVILKIQHLHRLTNLF